MLIGTLHDITPYRNAATLARAEVVRRDEFLATLSHELRNPLSAITSGFELLRQPELAADAREDMSQIIGQQLTQLRRLLDDLLDMTRLTQKRISLNESLLDLREPILAACRMSSLLQGEADGAIGGPDSRLRVEVGDHPLPIKGDAARLEQMVANLIGNGLKYTPDEGPVWVGARCVDSDKAHAPTSAGELEVFDPGECGVIELIVRDEGAGIEADLLPHLFDPFVQAQRTFGRSDGGFGIGLTLVRDIVSLHRGRVWAESDGPGRGSAFIVQIPASSSDDLKIASEAREPDDDTPPVLTILLVEDVPAIRKVTARLLQRIGHTVTMAVDAPTAIDAFQNQQFDLALVDIGLPGPSGLVIAETIRRDTRFDQTRLIALTGYAQEVDRKASIEAGFDRHLVKPFDLREFNSLVLELFPDR